jgi:hypothetical protein
MFKVPLKLLASIAVLTAAVAGTAYAGSSNAIDVSIPLLHVPLDSHAHSVLSAINGQTPGPRFGRDIVAPVATSKSQGFISSGGIGGLTGSHGKH